MIWLYHLYKKGKISPLNCNICWNLHTFLFKRYDLAAGTRIIYDRKFLLDRRNSPIAQTPPAHLPVIPGVTSQNVVRENQKNNANNHINKHDDKPANGMHLDANEFDRLPCYYQCSFLLTFLFSR